jgi:hypothetical protein
MQHISSSGRRRFGKCSFNACTYVKGRRFSHRVRNRADGAVDDGEREQAGQCASTRALWVGARAVGGERKGKARGGQTRRRYRAVPAG